MKQFSSFWVVLCLCFQIGNAQETTGKHTVTSGETLMEIAQHYNVTVEAIQDLNPFSHNGIKENDVLVIPKPAENDVSKKQSFKYTVKSGDTKYGLSHRFGISIADLENQNPHIVPTLQVDQVLQIGGNSEETIYVQNDTSYVVKSGDTKYGISKKFEVSIEKLEEMNPQIVPTLLVGQIVTFSEVTKNVKVITETINETVEEVIPKVKTEQPKNEVTNIEEEITKEEHNTPTLNKDPSQTTYISHTIQPGETLYGLSKIAGMSIEAFKTLNPILKTSVQTGMIVKMPSKSMSTVSGDSRVDTETVKTTSNYTDLTKSLIPNKKKKLMFFLPFSEDEFEKDDMNRDDLSEYVKNNRDFFRGALMAMDSAKALGLNFELDIFDTGSSKLSSNLMAMAKDANLNSFDAIIVSSYEKSAQDIASVVTKNNIPVVTISNLPVNKETSNLYEAVPSINAQRKTMLDYISSKKDSNLIVLNDKNRTESKAFISGITPEARFVEVKENGTFNSEDLVGMLKKNSKNYVVLDTDKKGVFISATNALLREMSNYSIQLAVLEFSLIPDDDDVSRKRFVILNMLYPSIANVTASADTKNFKELYKKQYYSEPVTMSRYGFDITFDTLLRLFQLENFEKVSNKITGYYTLKFEYQKNEFGYYGNFGVAIFQYETNNNHKQVY